MIRVKSLVRLYFWSLEVVCRHIFLNNSRNAISVLRGVYSSVQIVLRSGSGKVVDFVQNFEKCKKSGKKKIIPIWSQQLRRNRPLQKFTFLFSPIALIRIVEKR